MDKEKTKNSILKAIKEERFSDLLTNLEIVNFIIGESNSSFIIKLRNKLLESKEDFNFNDTVITNLILCIYSSALNMCLEEIIKIKKDVLVKKEHEEMIEWLNIELNSYFKQTEFVEKIKKSTNIIIEPNLLNEFEEALILEHEVLIEIMNHIRLEQIIKIMTQQKGF